MPKQDKAIKQVRHLRKDMTVHIRFNSKKQISPARVELPPHRFRLKKALATFHRNGERQSTLRGELWRAML